MPPNAYNRGDRTPEARRAHAERIAAQRRRRRAAAAAKRPEDLAADVRARIADAAESDLIVAALRDVTE